MEESEGGEEGGKVQDVCLTEAWLVGRRAVRSRDAPLSTVVLFLALETKMSMNDVLLLVIRGEKDER